MQQRAERAEAEVARLRSCSTVEIMCENPSVDSHVREWEARAEKAEAEVERLRVERDEAWAAANSAEAEMERLRNVLTTAVCSRPCCAPDRKWIGAHGFEIQAKR